MSKFCMNCGTELPEKALFCRKCGTKLEVLEDPIGEEASEEKNEVIQSEISEPQDPISKPVITNLDTRKAKTKLDLTKLDPTIIIVAAMILLTIIIVAIILTTSGNKKPKDNVADIESVEDVGVDDVEMSVVGTGEMEGPDTTYDDIDIEGNATTEPNTNPGMEPDESGNGTTENPDSMSSQEFINAWVNDSYLSIFEVPKFGESITIYKFDGYSSAFFYGWTTDEASTFAYDTVSAAGFTENVQTQIDADNFYYLGSNNQGYGVMVVKEPGGYVMVSVGDYGIMMGSSSTTVNDKVNSKLGNFQKDAFEKIGALE